MKVSEIEGGRSRKIREVVYRQKTVLQDEPMFVLAGNTTPASISFVHCALPQFFPSFCPFLSGFLLPESHSFVPTPPPCFSDSKDWMEGDALWEGRRRETMP
jgi:hypothetical protein